MTLPSDYYEAKAYVEIRREQAATARPRATPRTPQRAAELRHEGRARAAAVLRPAPDAPAPPKRQTLADIYDDARWNALIDRIADDWEAQEREGEWDV